MSEERKNKRIAQNAVALTLRMLLVMIVGLFTTRIVLKSLGVIDYGIYGVVGGIIGMASFLNFAMASATSRFITLEIGKGDQKSMKEVFSSSMIIMLSLCALVLFFAETVGLWFLNNKMDFPIDKMFSVNVLYQFTIISMIFSYTQVPYTAEILAHEDMRIYAYIEIFNTVSKLIIAYSLYVFTNYRLIIYGLLILLLYILVTSFYRFYAIRHYKETQMTFHVEKKTIVSMLKFAGYDLFGNMCISVRSQGQPIILNMFFGVIANAGASIASTISNCLSGFTSTVSQAFRPQIIKNYASGNFVEMEIMITRAAQFSLIAFSCITIPFLIETPRIIMLWLGEIPQYAVEFVRFMAISVGLNVLTNITITGIHAHGNIRNVSIITGLVHLLSLFFAFLVLRYGGAAWTMYCIGLILNFVNFCISVILLKRNINEIHIKSYIKKLLVCISIIVFSVIPIICLLHLFSNRSFFTQSSSIESVGIISMVTIAYDLVLFSSSYFMVFTKKERLFIKQFIKSKIGL